MLTAKRVSGVVCLVMALFGVHVASAQDSSASPNLQPVAAIASVPRLVRFNGVVKEENGSARTGATGVRFALYQDQAGGAALWQETQNVALDAQGRYSVLLGASSAEGMPAEAFSSNQARWLGIQPEGQAEQRVLLVSVPYALKAVDAETLGGMPASSFVLAAPPTAGTTGSTTGQTGTTAAAIASGLSPALTGNGNQNTLPKFDMTGANLIDSSVTDSGTAVSTTESVGIGTATPNAALDVEFSTATPTNAMLSNITYNNTTAVTNAVVSAFDMNFMDASTATNLSKQTARIALIRNAGATGTVTAFDSALTATEFLHASALYPIRGINIEGPTMDSGTSLSFFTGLYIGSPGGAGTVTNKYALVTEPNAGNVGIGTTSPGSPLEVAGNLTVSNGGVITGNGSGLTNLPAANLTGTFTSSEAITVAGAGATALTVQATDVTQENTAISGIADGPDGIGVYGQANGAGIPFGVWGLSTSTTGGLAGNFSGNVAISGTVSQGAANVKIDDPLDPANKYLYHASVQSSEMTNIYTGNIVLDGSGAAVVQLPSWFEALNTDFRYQLTAVGGPGPGLYVAQEIQNNSFRIAGGAAGLKVSWQVTGVRQDAFAKANPLVVEVQKSERERGYYIQPQLFGQPPTKSIDWAQHRLQMRATTHN